MKTKNTARPWLRSNGKPVCDSILRRICKSWDAETWEAYLHWYQRPCKEALLRGNGYEIICSNRTETIYREYGYQHDELIARVCEMLLRSLPRVKATVLQRYYLEGLTELQVSRRVRISPSGVYRRRKRALFLLGRENPAEIVSAIHIVRGLFPHAEVDPPTIWDEPFGQIREDRPYDPANWKSELQAIKNPALRQAISERTENQQRIVYLRFWCDQSDSQIARTRRIGVNSAQEICEAAVSRIKRRVVELTQNQEEVAS